LFSGKGYTIQNMLCPRFMTTVAAPCWPDCIAGRCSVFVWWTNCLGIAVSFISACALIFSFTHFTIAAAVFCFIFIHKWYRKPRLYDIVVVVGFSPLTASVVVLFAVKEHPSFLLPQVDYQQPSFFLVSHCNTEKKKNGKLQRKRNINHSAPQDWQHCRKKQSKRD